MEVLSIKGNKVNCDFTESEYEMLFRVGLQIWIDRKVGLNKIKVLPPGNPTINTRVKPLTKKEMKEEKEFSDELVGLAVNEALKRKIEQEDGKDSMLCDHANEVPAKCKCDEGCYCKTHTCKCDEAKKAKKAKK